MLEAAQQMVNLEETTVEANVLVPENRLPILSAPAALFFDIDGTLADIAEHPDDAAIPQETLKALDVLQRSSHAIAIISGRNLKAIDALTHPYIFPAAGQHGLEIRHDDGVVKVLAAAPHTMNAITHEMEGFRNRYPKLFLENKGLSLALHYRQAPEYEEVVINFLHSLATTYTNVCVQFGKMVGEIRLCGGNKGIAVQDFMQSLPFKNRIPVFVGDDLTDEDGFIAVNQMGGISIQVGQLPSSAKYFLDSPAALRLWISNINTDKDNKK